MGARRPVYQNRISRAFTAFGANRWVMRVLTKSFSSHRPFNFGSLEHRLELGIAIVDELRAA